MRPVDKSRTGRLLTAINVPLVVATLLLTAYGTLIVSSATVATSTMMRHLLGIGVGLVVMVILWAIDYRRYSGWIGVLGVLCAVLIISPLIPGVGVEQKGARSWVQFLGVQVGQPSEPAKLLFIVVLAWVMSTFKGRIETLPQVFKVAAVVVGAVALMLLQPDLGTSLVFIATALVMAVAAGMKGRYFIAIGLLAALGVFAIVQLDLLDEYQMDRLTVFIDPEADTTGAGYNLRQSTIAIGSGGITGKGLGAGTQSNLNFLPERHTDFIFAVLGEELGFMGGLVLLACYLALLLVALAIATSSRDLFGSLIAIGVLGMWLFQILENMGMTIGIMPITGIPLPFMSFGSSSMVTNLGAVGLLLSVWARRYGSQAA